MATSGDRNLAIDKEHWVTAKGMGQVLRCGST